MKNRQKALSVLLTLAIAVGLLPWTVLPARAEDAVPYVYYTADGGALTKHDGSVTDYTPVTGQTVAWSAGWYVAAGKVTIDGRVTVTGDVRLILCDGATLTAGKGVTVSGEGNSLTVYAQSNGSGMGALTATGNGYDAGIGGAGGEGDNGAGGAGGTVTVHGGAVTATGGSSDRAGAGIGGGAGRGNGAGGAGGTVTVYGGTVTATGGSNDQERGGAGIGGGGGSGRAGIGGTVAVYGGTVTATGGSGGAGIGSGGYNGGAGGALTVYGGAVIATGGKGGAGIGGGWGIGGGTVTINDGTVIATGGTYGAGIGGGNWGAGGAVEINGGTVTATGGEFNGSKGMGIGRGHNSENNGSLTIGEGVKLLTSADNSSWSDTTNNTGTRRQYMKTLSRAVACVTSGGTTTNYETLTAALDAWTNGTTLKLLADVETDDTITVGDGTNATSVTLDLNDHGIRANARYQTSEFRAIKVNSNAALTLEDTAASGTHRYITLGTIGGGADKVHGTAVSAVTPEGEVGTDYLAVTGGYITGGLAYDSSNSSNCDGGAVYVDGGGTFTMNGGTIAGNAALTGYGGVYVNYKYENGQYVGGTFTMSGGTIAGNTAWRSGGGVYVNQCGRFNMSGGTIAGNTAESGGGVHLQYSEFTMTGGKIADNKASSGGGVRADGNPPDYPCTFTMSGNAEISGNKASDASGGVYVYQSTFTMSGGTIIGNTAANGGGGVYVNQYGTFNMSDNARISSNESQNTSYGGGVFVTGDSSFTLNGGTVAGNTAYYGGGVYLSSGTLTLNGGTITGNNAASQGGGVGVDSGDGRTFNVSGGAAVTGNKLGGTFENGVLTGGTANNVHLYGSMTVTVTGALTSGAKLGVSMETPGTFTSELANGGADALKCFTSDSGAYVVGLNGGEAALLASSFAENGAVTAPKGAVLVCATYEGGKMTGVQTLTLAADCIGKAASKLLTVPASGQYKLFLLDGTTYAPLCAAWPNNNP